MSLLDNKTAILWPNKGSQEKTGLSAFDPTRANPLLGEEFSQATRGVAQKNQRKIAEAGIGIGTKISLNRQGRILFVRHITPKKYTLGLENENGVPCGSCSPHDVEVVE